MPRNANNPASKYVGLPEAEALQLIQADGLYHRIMGRDGESFCGTCDFRPDRVNLVITRGVVTTANIG